MTMYTQLAAVARRTGYPVTEVPGWKTRTRPQAMKDIRTITCHHTANGGAKGDYPSYNTVLNGRGSALPGPLAQYGIGVSGRIYVFAAGSANHAGESLKEDYEKVHAIGIEAEAVGVPGAKGDWPEKQMDSYAKLCHELRMEFGLGVEDVRGHKETCKPKGRKSDPSFSMDTFRARVRKVGTEATDQNKEDDDMPLTPKDVETIWTSKVVKLTKTDAAVWNRTSGDRTYKEGDKVSVSDMVRYGTLDRKNETRLVTLENQFKQLLELLTKPGSE